MPDTAPALTLIATDVDHRDEASALRTRIVDLEDLLTLGLGVLHRCLGQRDINQDAPVIDLLVHYPVVVQVLHHQWCAPHHLVHHPPVLQAVLTQVDIVLRVSAVRRDAAFADQGIAVRQLTANPQRTG